MNCQIWHSLCATIWLEMFAGNLIVHFANETFDSVIVQEIDPCFFKSGEQAEEIILET